MGYWYSPILVLPTKAPRWLSSHRSWMHTVLGGRDGNNNNNNNNNNNSEQIRGGANPSSRKLLWQEMSEETRSLANSIAFHQTKGKSKDIASANSSTCMGRKMHPRVAISRAITLMESKHPYKKQQGDLLLTYLLSLSSSNGNEDDSSTDTLRVGFAGPPGAGKSSLMEAFGMKLLREDPNLKLAVVCIDPSSNKSGGSILGDKTRMTELSRQVDRALVRPSSNSGILGGLAAYTDDVVRLLGCAGYPLVFVETVGLGQSEIEVTQSVDVLVLLIPPSGGDELQGVKKGIVESADIVIVTKTDGELEGPALQTAADYKSALRVLGQSSSSCDRSWKPPVVNTSSVTERGLDTLWDAIHSYRDNLKRSGKWNDQRRNQAKYWMWKHFGRGMQQKLQDDTNLRERALQLEREMLDGFLTPRVAGEILMENVFQSTK